MKFAPFAMIAALALAGCQEKAATPIEANPDAKPGLRLTGGQLVLPAVRGNPGAAYFTLTNGGAGTILAAVSVAGAEKTEMHETSGASMTPIEKLPIKSGQKVKFAHGAKHLMVFGIDSRIIAGSKAEITLTFADGDKLSAPLEVVAAGEMAMDNGEMP
jgi:copper(I)-binding protein